MDAGKVVVITRVSSGIQKPLEAEEIASAILYALEQAEHVAVSEIMVRPVTQEL